MEVSPPKVVRGFVLAVSAPSGTGKTSLCDRLAEDFSYVVRSVSATTRPKRDGETNGRDYEFLTPDEFKKRENAGSFLETAPVFKHWYGTPKPPVEAALQEGRVMVMDIDTIGAFNIRKHYPTDSVLLFILPPSLKELEKRLRQRGKNSAEELEGRLKEASREISEARRYDYLIRNENFDEAYGELKSIVQAERLKTSRLSA